MEKKVDKRNLLGTVSELLVAIDLMQKGYEVFHSMDGKTSCDFMILKNQFSQRVEVRAKTYLPKWGSKEIERMRAKADILALVVNEAIHYYPIIKE